MSNILRRKLQPIILTVAAGACAASAAEAQVGHPPGSSPYSDVRAKFLGSVGGGYSWGSGGKIGAGPTHGPTIGGRLDLHLAGPASAQAAVNLADLDRTLLDPNAGSNDPVVGISGQRIILADVGLIMTLTGQKTWYGFAPYIGLSMGVALGGPVVGDTLSAFSFDTKFMVGPQLGFRWHPVTRIFLRVEGRDMLWRLSYPESFFGGDPPLLDPQVNKTTQWTHNPMLLVALGFTFN